MDRIGHSYEIRQRVCVFVRGIRAKPINRARVWLDLGALAPIVLWCSSLVNRVAVQVLLNSSGAPRECGLPVREWAQSRAEAQCQASSGLPSDLEAKPIVGSASGGLNDGECADVARWCTECR